MINNFISQEYGLVSYYDDDDNEDVDIPDMTEDLIFSDVKFNEKSLTSSMLSQQYYR